MLVVLLILSAIVVIVVALAVAVFGIVVVAEALGRAGVEPDGFAPAAGDGRAFGLLGGP